MSARFYWETPQPPTILDPVPPRGIERHSLRSGCWPGARQTGLLLAWVGYRAAGPGRTQQLPPHLRKSLVLLEIAAELYRPPSSREVTW